MHKYMTTSAYTYTYTQHVQDDTVRLRREQDERIAEQRRLDEESHQRLMKVIVMMVMMELVVIVKETCEFERR